MIGQARHQNPVRSARGRRAPNPNGASSFSAGPDTSAGSSPATSAAGPAAAPSPTL